MYVHSARREIESFRVGRALWGISSFPLNCGLESFTGLAVLPVLCASVCLCMCVCVLEYAWYICVHYYVSLVWDTAQGMHCSLCQRVAKLLVGGRRYASAGPFSIVSAAQACSPPLGVIQHRARVHTQKVIR